MATRKQIRDALKTVVEPACACPIYTSRNIDATNLNSYVRIYFGEGEVDTTHLEETLADLVISYNEGGMVSDDGLDAISDAIKNAIFSNLAGVLDAENIEGLLWILDAGFNYGDENQKQYSTINSLFRIRYRE